MTVQIIPTLVEPHYTERMALDGEMFRLTFHWNQRALAWFFDLFDADDEVLFYGRRVVVNQPLTLPFNWRRGMPKGELLAFDSSYRNADPGFDDLGTRVLMLYIEAVELP